MKLRDYQLDMLGRTRAALIQHRRVIMQSPTGSGKTAMACAMIAGAVRNGKRVIFVVHQTELVKQTSAALWAAKIPHGLIVPGRGRTPHPVQVASLMTLKNRLDKTEKPDLLIVDESHRSAAQSYMDVFAWCPDAYVVGLTATPQRTDGKGLDIAYRDIVHGPSIRYLIDQGYLCDYQLFGVPQLINLEGVRTTGGDYNASDLERASDRPAIVGDAVEHYQRIGNGGRCVVMCVSIKHAEHVAAQYRAAGIPAEALHGLSDDRDGRLDRLRSGATQVLASVQLMVEGVDIPEVAVIQWLRPTKSLVIWMQGNGRGLRPSASKDHLVILDHSGNFARHGLPDMEREWSLDGRARRSGASKTDDEDDIGVQTCGSCFFTFVAGTPVCPHCGKAVPVNERVVEIKPGELERIERSAAAELAAQQRRHEQGRARELSELIAVGKKRGMRRPDAWAANVWASRQGRKPSRQDYNDARAAMMELMSAQQQEVRE